MKTKMNRNFKSIAINAIVLVMLANLSLTSCKKEDPTTTSTNTPPQSGVVSPSNPTGAKLATITTTSASLIKEASLATGGNVTSDGGANVTMHGVCYSSTNQTPTIADNKTSDGTGTGSFTSNLSNLTASTTYYIRSYATNSVGTNYGSVVTAKTADAMPTVTDKDGNVYHTVKIGTQTWMVENLKVTHYLNGDPITQYDKSVLWPNFKSGAYNNNKFSNGDDNYLYNNFVITDSRKICPTGWHVPTENEWKTLVTYLGGNTTASKKLKETGTTHWNSSNSDGTNESGFALFAGGSMICSINSQLYTETKPGASAEFWNSSNLYSILITNQVNFNSVYNAKSMLTDGYSIRLVKD